MKRPYFLNQNSTGASLMELIIAFGLFAIMFPVFIFGMESAQYGQIQYTMRIKASSYAQEASEAVRSVRESGWAQIASLEGTYHPFISGSSWSLGTGSENINGFTRSVIFSDVYRGSSGQISPSGTLDPSLKQAQITVAWNKPFPSSISQTIFLSRYLNNQSYNLPSAVSFDASGAVLTNVKITSSPQQVILANAPSATSSAWCSSTQPLTTVDLESSGIARSITSSANTVIAGSPANGANSFNAQSVKLTDPSPPSATPSAQIAATFSANYKTDAVFTDGSYVYLADSSSKKGVEILSISSQGTLSDIGSVTLSQQSTEDAIIVSGGWGFVSAGNTIYAFNDASPIGNHSAIATLSLPAPATSLSAVNISGKLYLFASLDATSGQLAIIDAGGLTQKKPVLSLIASLSLPGSNGRAITSSADGTRVYMALANSPSSAEIFVIDTSVLTSPKVISSFDLGSNTADPTGLSFIPADDKLLVSASGGSAQYIVIDLANELNPQSCGQKSFASGLAYGISAATDANGQMYASVLTGDSSAEVKIFSGEFLSNALSGVYESPTFDAGSSVEFNRITLTNSQPSGSVIKYKIASAPANNSGNCQGVSFAFVGPSGNPLVDDYFQTATPSASFTQSYPVPWTTSGGYANPGECLRYRAYLSTSSTTPALSAVSINYSP